MRQAKRFRRVSSDDDRASRTTRICRGLGVVLVLGVPDLGERLLRARLGGLGQRVEHVADLWPPAPLLAGLGEYLADRGPEPQGTVADREHRRGHATALTAAEQIERRLGRFA